MTGMHTNANVSDELRMSKLIRRLQNENNVNAALDLCAKLDVAVRTPANKGYMLRSFEGILDKMLSLLKQCTSPVLDECANILGLIGYINRMSYPLYEQFIFHNYRATKRLQIPLIQALRTTISYDSKAELQMYAEEIILMLKCFLESAEHADIFMAISKTIVQFSHIYRIAFERHFTDVVDIVIGWELEVSQSKEVKVHCAHILEQLSSYFRTAKPFSYGLLSQLVEDIIALDAMAVGTVERIGAFVCAFNTLLKCFVRMQLFVGTSACEMIVSLALSHLSNILSDLLLNWPAESGEALLHINELFCICLLDGYKGLDINQLLEIIVQQFTHLHHLLDTQKLSLLYLLYCAVLKLRAQLPAALVDIIFYIEKPASTAAHQYLQSIKLHRNHPAHDILLRTCQETLLIKNVPLMQQAYKHLTADIDACVRQLSNAESPTQPYNCDANDSDAYGITTEDAGVLLIFHLSALSSLAKQTNSIISMYACKPTILELLLQHCRCEDLAMWSKHATVYHGILNLLMVHCCKNHNFRTTSSLLREQSDDEIPTMSTSQHTSPTVNNFSCILNFLAYALEHAPQLATQNLKLLLNWTCSLLIECTSRSSTLVQQSSFVSICRSIGGIAARCAPRDCIPCIQAVLNYGVGNLSTELLQLYRDTSLMQLQTLHSSLHVQYAEIYAQLPLNLTLPPFQRRQQRFMQLYRLLSQHSPVRDAIFRKLYESLENSQSSAHNSLRDLYARSCEQTTSMIKSLDERTEKLLLCTRNSHRMTLAWLQYEAARYCVDQKLRSTLGKPQETFLGLEAIIMKYARLLSGCPKPGERHSLDTLTLLQLTQVQGNMRLLVGFLDALEKLIYNAAVGSACALRSPEKPVSAFFRLNNPTCQSWFNRIRIGVIITAMHCMQPELVIRYAQEMLWTQKAQDPTFGQAIVYLAWAWICCKEADSLKGLHIWAQTHVAVNGRSYQWLQYAADQAAERNEVALAGYCNVLADAELDNHTRQFVTAQLMQCLANTGQWQQLVEFKNGLATKRDEERNILNPFLQKWNSQLSALERLLAKGNEDSNTSAENLYNDLNLAIQNLTIWPNATEQWGVSKLERDNMERKRPNELEGQPLHISFSAVYLQEQLEDAVLNTALSGKNFPLTFNDELQQALHVNWRESLLNVSTDSQQFIDLTMLKHVVCRLKMSDQSMESLDFTLITSPSLPTCGSKNNHNMNNNSNHINNNNNNINMNTNSKRNGYYIPSSRLIKCLSYARLLQQRHNQCANLGYLYLNIATNAREEGNQRTCEMILQQYFGRQLAGNNVLQNISAQLINHPESIDIANGQLLRAYAEAVRCVHSQDRAGEELNSINVCAAFCMAMQKQLLKLESTKQPVCCTNINAELLLTLADWLTLRNGNVTTTMLQQLVETLPELHATSQYSRSATQQIPSGERLVARLINASVQLCPDWEEPLLAYGNWCYRWGKKIVDNGCMLTQADVQALGQAINGERGETGTTNHKSQTPNAVQLSLDNDTLNQLVSALNTQQQLELQAAEQEFDLLHNTRPNGIVGDANATEGETEAEAEADVANDASLRMQKGLRQLNLLSNKSDEVIKSIVEIWRRANANIYDYYKDAARSYFRYLQLKTSASCGQTRFHLDDSNLVTTTLRLLRLIVKHASGLQEVLEQGLKHTPIEPWKVIIPQLFSRLNHHESYVRKSVCALLCRLAESCPQLVIFPTVVGVNRELLQNPTTSAGSNCFTYLLGALSKQTPEEVLHVQLLVKELRRVCLLWDEYWMHSLSLIYNSYTGHIDAIINDFKAEDLEGKNNKFNSLRPQLLSEVESVLAFTSRAAETSYERSFKARFDPHIKHTVEVLRTARYPEAWHQLKQLYQIFQQNLLRGNSSVLKMHHISPVLSNISKTRIAMPGIDLHEQAAIYIESVDSLVAVLPTKTKPKKVAFHGSNGYKYTFLFKGLEDLHLDERIMQFLSISNAIMNCKQDNATTAFNRPGNICFKAHHYSVIPLGPQSGLISWVDGVTPLFSLYKKWQQRDSLAKQQMKYQRSMQVPTPSKRLTDLFYSRLAPLLAKYNMKVSDPRRQWPLSVLRQVLQELTNETPCDLLSRELWCQAANAAEWRQSVRRYTMCVAVMSVIGYVIGLGDRHLDNMLINLNSGDIVHIDYNVCFEKGRTLRIPEKVPFRLTQNMVHALGITGIEGAFRLSCEYVLKVMRKERETLLTLLEAFVYDPLVDWTVNDESTTLRRTIVNNPTNEIKTLKKAKSNKNKLLDWEAKRQFFANKLNQFQKFWSKSKMELQSQLAQISDLLTELQQNQIQRLATEQQLMELMQRSALAMEIKSLGTAMESHSFNTASQRYAVKKQCSTAFEGLAKIVQHDYNMVQRTVQLYDRCLDETQLLQLNGQLIEFKLGGSNWDNEYSTVAEVLRMHLPPETLTKYENTRSQIDNELGRLNDLALQCVEHMQQYSAIMQYYPEELRSQNLYVNFNASYTEYLQKKQQEPHQQQQQQQQQKSAKECCNNGIGSPGCSCNKSVKLNEAQILRSVWMRLSYMVEELQQLQQLQQQEQNGDRCKHTLHVTSALNAILEFNCSQVALYEALRRTLYKVSNNFSNFEKTALSNENDQLAQQQLQFVLLVRSICESVLGDPEANAMNNAIGVHLNEVQQMLTELTGLMENFKYEMPVTIFKLFLLRSDLSELNRFCEMGPEALDELFNKMQTDLPAETLEYCFFKALEPAYAQFRRLNRSLTHLARNMNLLLVENARDFEMQNYKSLGIFKESNVELHINCFFEVVIQTLIASKSFDMREFLAPMNTFVQFVESNYIQGMVSLSVYAWYTNLIGIGTTGLFESSAVSEAEAHCDLLFLALQEESQQLERQRTITFISKLSELQTLVASAHFWAYGSGFDEAELNDGHIITRQNLCLAIYENWQTLCGCLSEVQLLQHNMEEQMNAMVEQRSNWNRNHIDSLLRNEQLQKQMANEHIDVVSQVIDCASALCHLEYMNDVNAEEEQALLHNMKHWQEVYTQWQQSVNIITPVEEALVELLDPEGSLNIYWLETVELLLEDQTVKLQRDIELKEIESSNKHKQICALVKDIQNLQNFTPRVHARTLSIVQLKCEQGGKQVPLDVQLMCGHVRDCQHTLQALNQHLFELRKHLYNERTALSQMILSSWQKEVEQIQHMLSQKVDVLFKTVDEFLQNSGEYDSLSVETLTHNKGAINLNEQKRNAYGVSVWKKIRMKLEGRDPDSNQRSSIAEQIDYIIREATNADNLAVLYEGWTPWV